MFIQVTESLEYRTIRVNINNIASYRALTDSIDSAKTLMRTTIPSSFTLYVVETPEEIDGKLEDVIKLRRYFE